MRYRINFCLACKIVGTQNFVFLCLNLLRGSRFTIRFFCFEASSDLSCLGNIGNWLQTSSRENNCCRAEFAFKTCYKFIAKYKSKQNVWQLEKNDFDFIIKALIF